MNHSTKQTLLPFTRHAAGIEVFAEARFEPGRLSIRYDLRGALQQLVMPLPDEACAPQRANELWKSTCFECFFAVPGEKRYFELNLSSRCQWNLYRFDDYRSGMREQETNTPRLHLSSQALDAATVAADLSLPALFHDPAAKELEIGLSAVLEYQDGSREYRALTHPGNKPDFHLRESFVLHLAV